MKGYRNMDKIVKPMTICREEFIENLVQMCNTSALPFFVIEDVLKDFIKEIHTASTKQLEADKKKYSDSLAKAQERSEPKKDDV